ncbi:unnamed protein product [Auanema sp. JU1783]|nr:unnamed protein product [Auanema sp. JU1783]
MKISLFVITFFVLVQIVISQRSDYSRHGLKLRCFSCTTSYQCESGTCYGDFCMKIIASESYVVKGCENITRTVNSELYDPQYKQKSYCRVEEILGVDAVICYCRDSDYCNSSIHFNIFSFLIYFCIFLIFII